MLRCFTASLFLLFFPSLFFLHSDAPFPVISSTRRYLHTLYLFKIPFLEIKRPSRIIIFQRTLQHGCFYFIIRLKFPDSSIYSRISIHEFRKYRSFLSKNQSSNHVARTTILSIRGMARSSKITPLLFRFTSPSIERDLARLRVKL